MTSLTRLQSHVTHVPNLRLHHRELRSQESEVKSLVNLLLLIMERFQSILRSAGGEVAIPF